MARKPREIVDGAVYHVVSRINRREMVFQDEAFKDLFLSVLERAKQKYSFKIYNFCIMDNHIHLEIQPLDGDELSAIMRWILQVFAQIYNKVMNCEGHVWYDRFKSKVIRTMKQFENTFKYIANNPVRAKMVEHPLHYAYNAITWFQKNKMLGFLEPPDKERRILIEHFLKMFDPEKGQKTNKKYGFHKQRPGRPKKENNTIER
ncbi:MAG: transposase [Candidatus Margulisiibacteriota bacterium]